MFITDVSVPLLSRNSCLQHHCAVWHVMYSLYAQAVQVVGQYIQNGCTACTQSLLPSTCTYTNVNTVVTSWWELESVKTLGITNLYTCRKERVCKSGEGETERFSLSLSDICHWNIKCSSVGLTPKNTLAFQSAGPLPVANTHGNIILLLANNPDPTLPLESVWKTTHY